MSKSFYPASNFILVKPIGSGGTYSDHCGLPTQKGVRVHGGREIEVVYYDPRQTFAVEDLVAVPNDSIRAVEDDPLAAARRYLFDEIEEEREYQDKKWGGAAQDDTQSFDDFTKYIGEYSRGEGRALTYDFRTRMLKTAALAVAAIESYDRKDKASRQ